MRHPHVLAIAIITFFLASIIVTPTQAGNKECGDGHRQSDVLPPKLRMVLDELDKANSKLKDMEATVTYTREIPLLDESERSRGKIIFKKPDSLHLKLGDPRNEEVYSDGENWWLIDHSGRQVERYRSSEAGGSNPLAAFLDIGYGGSSTRLLKRYNITLEGKSEMDRNGGQPIWRLHLTPADSDTLGRFSSIEVELPEGLWLPSSVTLYESDGEIVHHYEFGDIRINTNVQQEAFDYSPPRGYTVLTP